MDQASTRKSQRSTTRRTPATEGAEKSAGELGDENDSSALLGNDLDYLIRTLRRRQVGVIDRMLAEVNLPLSAWYPLVVLSRGDGMSQRELARRLSLKDAAVGKAIDALERDALLRRTNDEADRRKFLVVLTPKGRKVAAQITDLRTTLLETMQKGFSASERELFKQFLQRAHVNLGGLDEAPLSDDQPFKSLQFRRSSK